MKVKKYAVIPLLCAVLLTGCTNKTFDKSMEEGKLAIASGEYEKAENMFSLALEEKKNDKEASALYSQTEKLIQTIKLKDEENYEEAVSLCDEILNIESELDLIKKKAKEIKSECEGVLSNNSEVEESDNLDVEKEETPVKENKEEESESEKEKIYSRSEVHSILQQQNKGGIYTDEEVYINGEVCYQGEFSWGMDAATKIRNFYVGSKTLNIYNYEYELKGTVYSEIINFDTEF